MIRKELDVNEVCGRKNLLGLPKVSKSLEDFQMGNFMMLDFKKLNISHSSSCDSLLSEVKIKELGLIASMCYFTAATERRFHELDEDMESLNIV